MKRKIAVIFVVIFAALLLVLAVTYEGEDALQKGEWNLIVDGQTPLDVDEVKFNEDGLVIYVTNTGNHMLWIDANSHGILVHTLLKKKQVSGQRCRSGDLI